MKYKITKIRKYGKGIFTSEKIGTQYYNVVYVYLYRQEDKNKVDPIKVHFIHMFDGDDLYYFFNYNSDEKKEEFTKEDIKQCRNELIFSAAESLFNSNDLMKIVNECNETIEKYA